VEGSAIPPDYTAVYKVLRNGKNLAEVTIRLSHHDDIWTLHGFTHDMRGLADLLKVKGAQTTTGKWQDGRFIPEDYKFSFSVIGYKTKWRAAFDWPGGVVTTSNKSGQKKLSLAGGAVDPFSLSLSIRSHLATNQTHMTVAIVDEDEIDHQVYQADREEPLDTTLGCMETTRVTRLHENSKRSSAAWYANEYRFIPVLMKHARKNGNEFSLQIISLDVAGQQVHPVGPCGNENSGSRQAALG